MCIRDSCYCHCSAYNPPLDDGPSAVQYIFHINGITSVLQCACHQPFIYFVLCIHLFIHSMPRKQSSSVAFPQKFIIKSTAFGWWLIAIHYFYLTPLLIDFVHINCIKPIQLPYVTHWLCLKQLHWLPVASRIKYKLCLLMHLIHTSWAPQYLANSVQSVTSGSRRCLRSTETAHFIKRNTRTNERVERGFSYAGPAAWNCLPPHLQSTTETSAFKHHLNHLLFIDSFS